MGFFKEIAEVLGYTEAQLALGYHYSNYNGAAVYIEGVKRILRIDGEEMVFQLPRGVLHVAGNGLTVDRLCGAAVLLRGEIEEVFTDADARKKRKDKESAT